MTCGMRVLCWHVNWPAAERCVPMYLCVPVRPLYVCLLTLSTYSPLPLSLHTQVCFERRLFAADCVALARHWRLLVLPGVDHDQAGGYRQEFRVGDRVAVDCGMSTSGDSHRSALGGMAHVPLRFGPAGAVIGPTEEARR